MLSTLRTAKPPSTVHLSAWQVRDSPPDAAQHLWRKAQLVGLKEQQRSVGVGRGLQQWVRRGW